MKWEDLSMRDRTAIMAAAVRNGYTDIRSIKEAYANYRNQKQSTGNRYGKGGNKRSKDDKFEVVNMLDNLPIWKALENIDYEVIADPEFTRDKTGAGSIEYFSAEEPEGITYTNGYHRDHPMPGHDVILYDPNTNDEQDIRLDALHIMPKDPTYDALNSLYRDASYTAHDDNYQNAERGWKIDRGAQSLNNTVERALNGPNAAEFVVIDPFIQYFNNEADGTLRSLLMEGDEEYRANKRYWPNKEDVRQWNAHLMPHINRIEQYLKTGKRPSDILPELVVTNKNAYGGNLFERGGDAKGIKGFFNLLKKHGIKVIETSGYRKGAVTKSGHASFHSMLDEWGNAKAQDFKPADGDWNKLRQSIYRNPELVQYMLDNNIGILEENTPEAQKRYGTRSKDGKGVWHAGYDTAAKRDRDNNIKLLQATYHPMQDVTWADVQTKKKQFELTPEEERLANTPTQTIFRPEYEDRNYPNYKESPLMSSIKLNPDLDKNINMWNMFISMQEEPSQDDQDNWINMLMAAKAKPTTAQQEPVNWLFAPQGNDYMYHGLNFAAYGGKVNKFDGITGNSTLENKGINDTDLITKYGFRYVPISSIYDLLNDDELNYNMNNEGMTLKEYYSKYPTAKIAVNKNNRIVTANDLKDLERKTILIDTQDFTPENWLSLRVEKPDGTKYDQTDVDALNSHLKEYHNIELASKQNGSWLKLPDGSMWNGDPRVWIMMQSDAFTKNYRQQPWYTGQGEWPTLFDYGDGEVKTNKMTRAPYYNDQMWFSNSKKYGDTFAYIWDSQGLNWRRNKENERNINGNNFISAIPKIGNYRKLTPPEHNSVDNWQHMPYELNGNSINRLPRNRIMKNLVDEVAGEPLFENTRVDQEDILTDDIANWSKQLGDDGLFMYQINDGPVATPYRPWEDIKYITDFSLNNKAVNEFISQPGFTNKIKFIEGNNGNFDISNPYKYKAFGGVLNDIY